MITPKEAQAPTPQDIEATKKHEVDIDRQLRGHDESTTCFVSCSRRVAEAIKTNYEGAGWRVEMSVSTDPREVRVEPALLDPEPPALWPWDDTSDAVTIVRA